MIKIEIIATSVEAQGNQRRFLGGVISAKETPPYIGLMRIVGHDLLASCGIRGWRRRNPSMIPVICAGKIGF
jgi:hypothetical protein